ncbi:hypothetical protein PPL_03329 [Heterostelium album PN500]|uniref:Uncharacterized protein n=1 Tax=Heterostelium pallidum (strain ATCC 26659 / Pp 5 / PN500) TaxID=670386 RepID=D3B4K4_HETP5|nr:hypothetical protein PPL_03329 [Heterostelium album PN500]EFA84252.1 hypothetical protein PPL_03329 [Heterostelium album PN500]|eukprot:XP_020436368.1 hypothetical protein PPL_03329 [Heterostelium album PN500]
MYKIFKVLIIVIIVLCIYCQSCSSEDSPNNDSALGEPFSYAVSKNTEIIDSTKNDSSASSKDDKSTVGVEISGNIGSSISFAFDFKSSSSINYPPLILSFSIIFLILLYI